MDELKPCPFCGKKIYRYYSSAERAFIFYHNINENEDCPVLQIKIVADSLSDAGKKWNRRME